MTIPEDDLAMLRHMLGLTNIYQRTPTSHRNYAAVTPGDEQFVRMAEAGLVVKTRDPVSWMQLEVYSCTQAGIDAAMASALARRAPRKSRVYHRFLEVSDSTGCTFREFLTDPRYADARKNA